MSCERERARVEELQGQHADAKADCKDGIKAQCGRVAPLERQLRSAREVLKRCLEKPVPVPPPDDVPPADSPPEEPPVLRCAAQRARVDELTEQHADAKADCNDGLKVRCGQVGPLARKLALARAALQDCLDQPVRTGTVFPRYLVTHLLYSPPGKGSEASYESGSTTGITVDVTRSFKAGLELSAGGEVFGSGVELSVEVTGGVTSGHSFEVRKESSSGVGLESRADSIDHGRDVFFIWTNIRADIGQRSSGSVVVSLGLSGDGRTMDVVPLTVAQLRDPSLIPEQKKARLADLTPEDFREILGLHPLLDGGDVDLARLRFIKTLQVSGPDHEGDSPPHFIEKLSDERATGVIAASSQEITVGLTVKTGFNLFSVLHAEVETGLSWQWAYEKSSNITTGQVEEATVKFQSETVEYFEVVDVYQDTMFKTFAFVSAGGPMSKDDAIVSGLVTDATGVPAPSARVDVIKDNGEVQTTITNAQGVYRVFGLPEGTHRIAVGEVIEEITVPLGETVYRSFII